MQDPAAFFYSAKDTWWQSLQVFAAVKQGKLDPSNLPTEFSLTTDPTKLQSLRVRIPNTSTRHLESWANNVMASTLGTLAMAAEGALEAKFGTNGKAYEDKDSNRRAVRCIWYMIRCAFAHPSKGTPTWSCNKDYQDVFKVNSITIDTRALNGQVFSIAHLGGWENIPVLLQETERLLAS